jgi:ubiquinone/menaquinone biosynthesis C-methylase UbiE
LLIYFKRKTNQPSHAVNVGQFYDEQADAFQQVYGDVIQAFRTIDVSDLLDYQANTMQLKIGMKLLDAGCGVGGPALYFVRKYGVRIDGITASPRQASIANERINAAGFSEKLRIVHGDYHDPAASFTANDYDVVYFLESFGHSNNKKKAIDAAWKMLKPGGMLYIKDLFIKESNSKQLMKNIRENVEKINRAYRYNVADLNAVLTLIRQKGFILSQVKTIDIPLDKFENLSLSNVFQDLTGINRIDNLQAYIFPVDFFELICIKPWGILLTDNNRYFLQNLYYMQTQQASDSK